MSTNCVSRSSLRLPLLTAVTAALAAFSLPAAAQVAGDPVYVLNQHGASVAVSTVPYSFANVTTFSDGEWINTNSADGTTRLGSTGYFYDAYSFVVNSSAPVSFSTVISSLSGIDNVQARLYSGYDPLTNLGNVVADWSTSLNAPAAGSILASNQVGNGTYTVEVRGLLVNGATAVDSGSYAMTLNISSVPEGDGLMFALSGLAGLAALRRRNKR